MSQSASSNKDSQVTCKTMKLISVSREVFVLRVGSFDGSFGYYGDISLPTLRRRTRRRRIMYNVTCSITPGLRPPRSREFALRRGVIDYFAVQGVLVKVVISIKIHTAAPLNADASGSL